MERPSNPAASDEQLDQLFALTLRDPHSVLGVHPDGNGLVLRTWRPDAKEVYVLPDSGGRVPMRHRRNGVFEARVNGKAEVFSYLLEVVYPHEKTFLLRDPYAFLPTLGEIDLHLFGQGKHERLWEKLGAHPAHHHGVGGVSFAVWAPHAVSVSVVGDFNSWDGRLHPMRAMGTSGVWELFIPELSEGARYKFEIRTRQGPRILKADPFAFRSEVPPATASVVHDLGHFEWSDQAWMNQRGQGDLHRKPVSIYELHLGSWRRKVEEANRPLTYRELADSLCDYVSDLGFTHVELLPVAEHPFGGSWGYQVSGYFAPTSRYGHPDDLRYLIDRLHARGIGVLVDWVPGHFPRDAHCLGRFDGLSCYEHADPRQGAHPDWGTYIFNFGRSEVRNFLISNALFWLREYHVDGLRVDAVASMLYLDYSRQPGQWIPNKHGGRENLEAIEFLQELNQTVGRLHPDVLMIAEESTSWPKVTQPVEDGGLGFHLKWNMGWMHDTLKYFRHDPIHRAFHHHALTFGMMYAYSEHFLLPLSHDEVVHGKGSLLGKTPGDFWKQRANLRALFAWMWSYPGKKLLFMGGELGQPAEWNHDQSLDWHLLEKPEHRGIQHQVQALNRHYLTRAPLHAADAEQAGFQWLQADSANVNVYAYLRKAPPSPKAKPEDVPDHLVCVANFSPVPRHLYRVGFPLVGKYVEVLNTDAQEFGGAGLGNLGEVTTEATPWNGQPASADLTLPPLAMLWLAPVPVVTPPSPKKPAKAPAAVPTADAAKKPPRAAKKTAGTSKK